MSGETKRELTAENRQFTFSAQPQFSLDQAGGTNKPQRKFAGVAYSGEVIPGHWYWGNVIFDLGTMSVPDKLPALIDHSRGQRCGYVTASQIDNTSGLTVSGNLLSNSHGQAVASESDEGFPWQMSVHIEPGSIEEVLAGSNIMVNGKHHAGPITVFRNSKIVEVSFTATGWDSNTSAAAMSRGGSTQATSSKETPMTPEEKAKMDALEAENAGLKASNDTLTKERDAATAQVQKFSSDIRVAEVKSLFGDIGREFKADDPEIKAFSAMTQESFDATAKVMRDQFKKPAQQAGAGLFTHQAASGGQGQQSSAPAVNPLIANAKARADQFSKRPS